MKFLWGLFLFLMGFVSVSDAATLRARNKVNFFWEEPSESSKLIGRIPKSAEVQGVPGFEAGEGEFYRVFANNSKGKTVVGFVKKDDFEIIEIQTQSNEDHPQQDGKWGLGFGLSGSSSGGSTQFIVGVEGRYLWNPVFENSLALDLGFGGGTVTAGSRFLNRLYLPTKPFKPYIQGGIGFFNLASIPDSGAWIAGLGVQILRRGGAFFEVGADYYIRRPFNESVVNTVVFGGSSGFRF